jgi:molybdopterin-containing oxidoreductase family membrane subunit
MVRWIALLNTAHEEMQHEEIAAGSKSLAPARSVLVFAGVGLVTAGASVDPTLLLVARRTMRFEHYITERHIDAICKLIITTGGIIGMAYAIEVFMGLYSSNPYEHFAVINRAFGPLAWGYWVMIACNVAIPQLLWLPAVRRNLPIVFVVSVLINVGMWFERFIIIVSSLERSFLLSSWSDYAPTWVEVATLIGSFGLFFSCFLMFARFVPMISISEVKTLLAHRAHGPKAELR